MIYFLGDTHGDFRHIGTRVLADRPAAVVFLGDIEADRPFMEEIAPLLDAGIDVRWIRGNHDTDTKANWDNLADAMHLNIDGQVVEVDGLRIAGLGGVFRGEIWYPGKSSHGDDEPHFDSYEDYCRVQQRKQAREPASDQALEANLNRLKKLPGTTAAMIDEIRYGKALKHHSTIFRDVYERLMEERADILVTHEAPSCHPLGFSAIDDLARTMHVKAVFHGHHHDSLDYRQWEAKLGFKAFGVRLCGIVAASGAEVA